MRPAGELVLVNMQSETVAPCLAAVAAWLRDRTGLPVRFDDAGHWTDRRERLFSGDAQLGFLCGLPYALEADRPAPRVTPLAAPVMAAARYKDRAVYFSDVVVRADAPFTSVSELAGRSWAYNEPDSHSGHAITRYELARRGVPAPFFGTVVEAGSHMNALALVRAGRVDAAAIDSTVLALAAHADPALLDALRVIATWGPSPMPPLLASAQVPAPLRDVLADALLAMHGDAAGREALALGLFSRFAPATDASYDPLREMAATARRFPLLETCRDPR